MVPEPYTVEHPSHLDEGKRWFVPGLCYAHAKFPQSIIQTLKPPNTKLVPVTSYLVPKPLYVPSNFQMPLDNWQRTIQGLALSDTMHWLMHLEAVTFRMHGKAWRIRVQEVVVGDPFSLLRTTKLFYLLPGAEDHQLAITKLLNGVTAVIENKQHG
jgi:hypothetical protein